MVILWRGDSFCTAVGQWPNLSLVQDRMSFWNEPFSINSNQEEEEEEALHLLIKLAQGRLLVIIIEDNQPSRWGHTDTQRIPKLIT